MSFLDLADIEERELIEGYHVRFIHTENLTLAYWNIKAGHDMPSHAHPHEQVANLLEGTFELTVDGATRTLEPGSVALIPPHTVHSGRSVSDCRLLDVFYPVREDYF